MSALTSYITLRISSDVSSVMSVSVTAVRTAVMVITAGIVDMCKKTTVRIGVVSHGPGVAARLFHGVLADDLFSCECKKGAQQR